MSKASRPLGRAPTFGVLVDWLEGEYQSSVIGVVLDAAREYGLDLSRCFMVGDRESDIQAGINAGTRTILV